MSLYTQGQGCHPEDLVEAGGVSQGKHYEMIQGKMQRSCLGRKTHVSCFMLETGWLGGLSVENDLEVLLESKLNMSQSVPWQHRSPAASQMTFRGSQPGA